MSMQTRIEQKLSAGIPCKHLRVENESHMHARGSESHFKVVVVSDQFAGQRLLQRHRTINDILAQELREHIHALAIHAYTPEEFSEKQGQAPDSPRCLGGSKFDN
ncbi:MULTISPECIES: BolA family protein [unclassified Pseudoalteromonas]|uniref:BolA family protein n=1 Tax=unclassified Pseudoalteromonas TaxID=194690 RepID=UPI000CF70BAE|nr:MULTISPECIES: BolA family protein [unclassified Pseudoalteromonas]